MSETRVPLYRKEDQQGIGRQAPLLEKLRLQYPQSSQDPKSRQSWTGESSPVYPPFPLLSAKDDLPERYQDRALLLQDEP